MDKSDTDALRNAVQLLEHPSLAARLRYAWIFDVRVPENPISISTLPIPSESRLLRKGRKFRHTQSLGKPAGRFPEFTFHFRNLLQSWRSRVRYRERVSAARGWLFCAAQSDTYVRSATESAPSGPVV